MLRNAFSTDESIFFSPFFGLRLRFRGLSSSELPTVFNVSLVWSTKSFSRNRLFLSRMLENILQKILFGGKLLEFTPKIFIADLNST